MQSLYRLRIGLIGLVLCLCVVWGGNLAVGSSPACEDLVSPLGGLYNLSALVGQTYFANTTSYDYRFAICGGISDSCPGNGETDNKLAWKCNTTGIAGACHTWENGNYSVCLGVGTAEPNITDWIRDGAIRGIAFMYMDGDDCGGCSGGIARTTQITIVCNPVMVDAPSLSVTDADASDGIYTIFVEHASGCAIPAPQEPPVFPEAPEAEPIAPPLFCPGTKPSASFECQNGVWTLIGSLNVTDGEGIIIDSPLVIIGNLFSSNSSSITVSVGSFINVTECAIIGGVLNVIVDSEADLALLLENPLQPLLSSGCLEGEFSEIQVRQSASDGCNQVTGATVQTTSVNHLSLLFQLGSTCDGVLGEEVQWYVIVAPIIAALVLAVIIFVVIAFRVPAVRNCIRPFASRSTPAAPATTETEMTTVEPVQPAGWTAALPNS